jgi:hypothetical protein
MDASVVSALRESNWRSLCHSCQTSADAITHSCLPEFRDLVVGVVRRFTQRPPPQTDAEFNVRMSENNCIACIVGSIVQGSTAASSTPSARQAIYDLAKALSEIPLGTPFADVLNAGTVFSLKIRNL